MPLPDRLYAHVPSRNRRLAPELYAEAGSGSFWTLRAYRGNPFAANPELCRTVIDLLAEMRAEYRCWVSAYCLMPDHLHFVAGPKEDGASVLTFVARFSGKSTNRSWQHGWEGKLWQPRGHDHLIRKAEDLREIYAYTLANPVRAGLVEEPEAWPWSGILDPIY